MPYFVAVTMSILQSINPVHRAILSGLVFGCGSGLFFVLSKWETVASHASRTVGKVFGIILMILPWFVFIPAVFDSLRGGLGAVFGGIFGAFVAMIAGTVAVWLPLSMKRKSNMRSNKLVKEVIAAARQNNVAAIALCHDGVRIFENMVPYVQCKPGKVCTTRKEFDNYVSYYTSYMQIHGQEYEKYTDISFSSRGFPPLSEYDENTFAEVVCKALKNYHRSVYKSVVTYSDPSYSYQIGSNYYSANGNLLGTGSRNKTVDGSGYEKYADYLTLLVRKDLAAKNAAPASPVYREKW